MVWIVLFTIGTLCKNYDKDTPYTNLKLKFLSILNFTFINLDFNFYIQNLLHLI